MQNAGQARAPESVLDELERHKLVVLEVIELLWQGRHEDVDRARELLEELVED